MKDHYLKITEHQYLQNLADAFSKGARTAVVTMLRDLTGKKAFAEKLEAYLTKIQEDLK